MFAALYEKTLAWARHPKAPWILGAVSAAESSVFPIPPDVMLAPMVLARPERAWGLATLTTLTSVLGGALGYLIGMFMFAGFGDAVIDFYHARDAYETVQNWFTQYGVWVVFIAGFTPVPYKLFTITSGVMAMAFLPFVIASTIGRGARFFLVAGILHFGGEKLEAGLRKRIDLIGWVTVILVIAAIVYITVR